MPRNLDTLSAASWSIHQELLGKVRHVIGADADSHGRLVGLVGEVQGAFSGAGLMLVYNKGSVATRLQPSKETSFALRVCISTRI